MLKLKEKPKTAESQTKARSKKLEHIIFTFLALGLVVFALVQGHVGGRHETEKSEDPLVFWLFVGAFLLSALYNLFNWIRISRHQDNP